MRCGPRPFAQTPSRFSYYKGYFLPERSSQLPSIFASLAGWSYDEHHLINVCGPRLRLFRLEVFVSDMSFDSDKHDQTRQDAERGGESLMTAADSIGTLADAQVESVWGEEAGVDAARRALQDSYLLLGDGFKEERNHFLEFGTKVDQSEEAFRQMEEQNADYFSQAAAAMSRDPAVAAAAAGSGAGAGSGSSASTSQTSPSESQDNTNPNAAGSSEF